MIRPATTCHQGILNTTWSVGQPTGAHPADVEPRSLKYLAEGAGGDLRSGSPSDLVSRICTDSRQVRPGDLFVALAGDRFDGHDYVGEVREKKASAILIRRDRDSSVSSECGVIVVGDTREALGRIGARYRRDFSIPIIAVGGSNGKTTTKELLASVLSQRYRTVRSAASFNNNIGVPLTLLELDDRSEAAVLEVGTNHPGELAPLIRMMQPQFGVITSVGREHLEFFGDLSGVEQEEGWLAELLPVNGRLFVNGDSPGMQRIVERTAAPVTRIGLGTDNDWRAKDLRHDESGVSFQVDTASPGFSGEYRVNLLGRHQVTNALLAAAVGATLGLTRDQIVRGMADCLPAKMRLQVSQINGVRILDDAYNANADSVLAALDTLKEYPCAGRRIAVLGEMAELGRHSAEAHAEVGRRVAELKLDQLFAVGRMAGVMGAAARAAGLTRVNELGDVETAANAVRRFVRDGDVVLLKASRASRLERVGEVLRNQEQP
jgi:UDP-N-acetylmuramoyl-tripeptide--D-alanyl-D-alanine ligase